MTVDPGNPESSAVPPGVYERVFGVAAPDVDTEFGRISHERVVDGLWDRPNLADRDRRLLTLAVLAAGSNDAALDTHLDGALSSGDLTAVELEEVAIHLAHYAGWPVGARLALASERAVERRHQLGTESSTNHAAVGVRGTVGVVGVGALGADVAATLVRAGTDVVVHDVNGAAAAAVEGASVAADLAGIADRCDVVSIVVRDDAQVLDVVGHLAAAARPGTILLVHSTVSVATIEQAAAAAASAAGLDLLDVGLCRPAGMDSGLVALVGGDRDVIDRALPVIDTIADHVHVLGPLGSGMVVKAVRNAILYGAYASVSEGVDICRAAGVDGQAVLDALRTSGAAGSAGLAFIDYRDQWIAGGHADRATREGFVDLAHKDIGVAIAVASDTGASASFAHAVAGAMPAAYLTEPDEG